MTDEDITGHINLGQELRDSLLEFFKLWDRSDGDGLKCADEQKPYLNELMLELEKWSNRTLQLLHGGIYFSEYCHMIKRHLSAVQRFIGNGHCSENSCQELSKLFQEAFFALKTVPTGADETEKLQRKSTPEVTPDTAFIMMWMDPDRPELVDVLEAVRETFRDFGITAKRADDIEHQDRITKIVLDQIKSAEFLFADLTGVRPNVYYEVGYAHAKDKLPILFRSAGTPIQFDLVGHNIPEYKNLTELKSMLRKRLEKLTGRTPVRN